MPPTHERYGSRTALEMPIKQVNRKSIPSESLPSSEHSTLGSVEMTPPSTSSFTRPSDTHHRRTRTQPRQRIRPLPLSVVERAALSDTGLRREHNEDSFMIAERVFAVADGVGGGRAGE